MDHREEKETRRSEQFGHFLLCWNYSKNAVIIGNCFESHSVTRKRGKKSFTCGRESISITRSVPKPDPRAVGVGTGGTRGTEEDQGDQGGPGAPRRTSITKEDQGDQEGPGAPRRIRGTKEDQGDRGGPASPRRTRGNKEDHQGGPGSLGRTGVQVGQLGLAPGWTAKRNPPFLPQDEISRAAKRRPLTCTGGLVELALLCDLGF